MRMTSLFFFLFLPIISAANPSSCAHSLPPHSIFLEKKVKIHQLKVADSREPDAYTEESLRNQSEIAIDVRKAIFEKVGEKGLSVGTVVYPASGFDGAAGFLVFPSATHVIGIDNHPFVLNFKDSVRERFVDYEYESGYTSVGTVDLAKFTADFLLGRMARSLPGFRLRNIFAISQSKLIHGVIQFDTGPGTPVKQYIHIHDAEGIFRNHYNADYQPPWWATKISKLGFDAIIIKGAMDFFNRGPNSLGINLVEDLRKRQGILIDGDSMTRWPWLKEMSPLEIRKTNTGILGFGYGSNVQIFNFGKAEPQNKTGS